MKSRLLACALCSSGGWCVNPRVGHVLAQGGVHQNRRRHQNSQLSAEIDKALEAYENVRDASRPVPQGDGTVEEGAA